LESASAVTVWVTVALASLIASFIALHYYELQQQMLERAETSLDIAGQAIEGSLEHTMLSQDADELQRIIDRVAQQPEIRSMVLLNRQSEVRFAPRGEGVGTRLDPSDPGCEACHRAQEPEQGSTILITSPQGESLLRYCIPIRNQPICYDCHDSNVRVNGALITDFSLSAIQSSLDAELRNDIVTGLLLVAAGVVAVNLLLDRMILSADRTLSAIRRFGAGDYSQHRPQGGDEIGQVAAVFNDMASGLQARAETSQLYQELQHKERRARSNAAHHRRARGRAQAHRPRAARRLRADAHGADPGPGNRPAVPARRRRAAQGAVDLRP
jgi:HAMP domain-containing protein